LNEFYESINKEKKQFEIVFIGSDPTKEDQLSHFREKQGPWWMIPFDHDLRNSLKKKVNEPKSYRIYSHSDVSTDLSCKYLNLVWSLCWKRASRSWCQRA
jgi:hypothetical protein